MGPVPAGEHQAQVHQLRQDLPLAAQTLQQLHQLHVLRVQGLVLRQHGGVGQVVHHPQDLVIALAQNGGAAVRSGVPVPQPLRSQAAQSPMYIGQCPAQLDGNPRQHLAEHLLFGFAVFHVIQPPSTIVYDSGKARRLFPERSVCHANLYHTISKKEEKHKIFVAFWKIRKILKRVLHFWNSSHIILNVPYI